MEKLTVVKQVIARALNSFGSESWTITEHCCLVAKLCPTLLQPYGL